MQRFHEFSVNVKVAELLEKVRENQEDHVGVYVEAHKQWKADVIEQMREHLQMAEADEEYVLSINLQEPQSYAREYEQLCSMLMMCQDEVIEIDAQQHRAWVMDEWSWKHAFTSNSSMYINRG